MSRSTTKDNERKRIIEKNILGQTSKAKRKKQRKSD